MPSTTSAVFHGFAAGCSSGSSSSSTLGIAGGSQGQPAVMTHRDVVLQFEAENVTVEA
jgi:hypothetical protein